MQVVEVVETCLDALGNRDRLGVGQRTEITTRAGNDVGQQADVRAPKPGLAGQAPQSVQVRLGHVRQHDVLLVGNADFTEAELLGPVGDRVHLPVSDVTRRRGQAGLGRQHHTGVTRHFMRLHVARHPARERGVFGQPRAEIQVGVRQSLVARRHEGAGDPLVLEFGQLCRAVLEVLPLLLHFPGKGVDPQGLHQDLDPCLVLVVAPTMTVVHPQHRLDVGQQVLPGQPFTDLQAEDRRAPQATADDDPQQHLPGGIRVKVQADVMHHDRRAVLYGRADGDLELARQVQELGVDGRPLAEDFR
ncbi:hypothetical protein D3C84_718930 [compost metagenome]